MGLLDDGLPCEVEVCGEAVPVRTGFRRGVRASLLDRRDPDDRLVLMALLYGEPQSWPDAVLRDQRGALAAGLGWLDGAWEACTYGKADGSGGRRTFDFAADSAIVAADFQRLYGIDLLDPETRMHWWRFTALLAGAMRTEGALVSQAVDARSPMPQGVKGRERERLLRRRRAWAIPPSEADVVEAARAAALREFGG